MGKKATGKFANLIDYRYIFFTSLPTHGTLYKRLEERGKGYVDELRSKIGRQKAEEELGQQAQSAIPQYINFIKDLKDKARANEIDFIQKHQQLTFKDDKLQKKVDEFCTLIKDGKPFNYRKFLQVINILVHQNEKNQKEMLQSFIQMLKTTTGALKKQKQLGDSVEHSYKEIEQSFVQGSEEMEEYKKHMRAITQGLPFESIGTNLYAQKIEGVIGHLAKDKDFLDEAERALNNQGVLQDEQGMYLISFVTDFIVEKSLEEVKGISPKDLLVEFEDQCKKDGIDNKIKNAQKQYIKTLLSQFAPSLKDIEKLAFDRRGAGKEFLKMTDQSQWDFIDQYEKIIGRTPETVQLAKLITEIKQGRAITSETYRQISIRINRIIREAFDRRASNERGLNQKEWAKRRQAGVRRSLSQNLRTQISVSIKGSTLAEVLSSREFVQNVCARIFQGGTKIKTKNDVFFLVGLDDLDFLDDPAAKAAVTDIFSSFPEDVSREIHRQLVSDSADIKKQEDAYIAILQQTSDKLKQIVANGQISDSQRQEILRKFNESFFGGISVKNYMYAADQLGFHGGSLGKNSEKIVENVTEMYELGGISQQDMKYIYFGVANCGADGIANGLETDIASFLLGAAAIMMFDTGFAQTQGFLQKVSAALGQDFSPQTLNLFQLNYGVVPASIVYENIYNNLLRIYQDMTAKGLPKFMTNSANRVTITNTITEEHDKPPYDQEKADHNENYLLDRWKEVAKIAEKKDRVDISFTFMAGILDVLQNIEKAFEQ